MAIIFRSFHMEITRHLGKPRRDSEITPIIGFDVRIAMPARYDFFMNMGTTNFPNSLNYESFFNTPHDSFFLDFG